MILRHCCAVLAEHTTQQWNQTASWLNIKQESDLWYSTLAVLGVATQTARMAWARLALVPAAVALNLTFLYIVARNAPGEVWGQLLLKLVWWSRMLGFRLAFCISPQASRTFAVLLECWEFIISCILNTSSCSSRQLTFSNRFTQSFWLDHPDHVHLQLCCRPLQFLDLFSWMFWRGPFLAPTLASFSAVSSLPVELPSAFSLQGITVITHDGFCNYLLVPKNEIEIVWNTAFMQISWWKGCGSMVPQAAWELQTKIGGEQGRASILPPLSTPISNVP